MIAVEALQHGHPIEVGRSSAPLAPAAHALDKGPLRKLQIRVARWEVFVVEGERVLRGIPANHGETLLQPVDGGAIDRRADVLFGRGFPAVLDLGIQRAEPGPQRAALLDQRPGPLPGAVPCFSHDDPARLVSCIYRSQTQQRTS